MLKKIGKESRFVNGMRYTDEETMEIVQMVLAGKVNKDLVQLLEMHSGRGSGPLRSGREPSAAEKIVSSEDLGYVGEITEVNTKIITDCYLPGVYSHCSYSGGKPER